MVAPAFVKSLIPPAWDVPEVFRARLGDQAGRQRTMQAEGHLLLVTHVPPNAEEAVRRGRFFWRSPTGEWKSSDLGVGSESIGRHLGEYARAIEKLDLTETRTKSAEDFFRVLEGLAPLQRSMQNLQGVLADARKLIPDDRSLLNHRDRAYDLTRTAELQYTEAKNLLDYDIARRAEQHAQASHRMATSAHRLNVLAAMFFPVVTLSSLFGMNLRSGLEDFPTPWSWIALVCAGLVMGLVLALIVTIPSRLPGSSSDASGAPARDPKKAYDTQRTPRT